MRNYFTRSDVTPSLPPSLSCLQKPSLGSEQPPPTGHAVFPSALGGVSFELFFYFVPHLVLLPLLHQPASLQNFSFPPIRFFFLPWSFIFPDLYLKALSDRKATSYCFSYFSFLFRSGIPFLTSLCGPSVQALLHNPFFAFFDHGIATRCFSPFTFFIVALSLG